MHFFTDDRVFQRPHKSFCLSRVPDGLYALTKNHEFSITLRKNLKNVDYILKVL